MTLAATPVRHNGTSVACTRGPTLAHWDILGWFFVLKSMKTGFVVSLWTKDVSFARVGCGACARNCPHDCASCEREVAYKTLHLSLSVRHQLLKVVTHSSNFTSTTTIMPLEDGIYTITSSERPVGRYHIEDRSLLPKRVFLLPQDVQAPHVCDYSRPLE